MKLPPFIPSIPRNTAEALREAPASAPEAVTPSGSGRGCAAGYNTCIVGSTMWCCPVGTNCGSSPTVCT